MPCPGDRSRPATGWWAPTVVTLTTVVDPRWRYLHGERGRHVLERLVDQRGQRASGRPVDPAGQGGVEGGQGHRGGQGRAQVGRIGTGAAGQLDRELGPPLVLAFVVASGQGRRVQD